MIRIWWQKHWAKLLVQYYRLVDKTYNYCWLILVYGWLCWLVDWGNKPRGTSGFYILRGASEALTGRPVWPLVGWYPHLGFTGLQWSTMWELLDHVIDLMVIWGPVEAFLQPVAVLGALPGVLVMWFILKKIKLIMLDLISTWLEQGSVKISSIIMW